MNLFTMYMKSVENSIDSALTCGMRGGAGVRVKVNCWHELRRTQTPYLPFFGQFFSVYDEL